MPTTRFFRQPREVIEPSARLNRTAFYDLWHAKGLKDRRAIHALFNKNVTPEKYIELHADGNHLFLPGIGPYYAEIIDEALGLG